MADVRQRIKTRNKIKNEKVLIETLGTDTLSPSEHQTIEQGI